VVPYALALLAVACVGSLHVVLHLNRRLREVEQRLAVEMRLRALLVERANTQARPANFFDTSHVPFGIHEAMRRTDSRATRYITQEQLAQERAQALSMPLGEEHHVGVDLASGPYETVFVVCSVIDARQSAWDMLFEESIVVEPIPPTTRSRL